MFSRALYRQTYSEFEFELESIHSDISDCTTISDDYTHDTDSMTDVTDSEAEVCIVCLDNPPEPELIKCPNGCRGGSVVCEECYKKLDKCVFCRRRFSPEIIINGRAAMSRAELHDCCLAVFGGLFVMCMIVFYMNKLNCKDGEPCTLSTMDFNEDVIYISN